MSPSHAQLLVHPRCIYCLTTEGRFTEEHFIGESLGNRGDKAIVLPKEYTCEECNLTTLSPLDQELVNYPAIAFLRVHFISYTKHGKRPKAGFRNLSLQRIDEERVLIFVKDKSGLPKNIRKRNNEQIEYDLVVKGEKLFRPALIGRALYKIALGAFAFEYGQDQACRRRYNEARAFIKYGQSFSNNLAMLLMSEEELRPTIQVNRLIDLPGTIYGINIYGLRWVLNLEPLPILQFDYSFLPKSDSPIQVYAEFSSRWALYPLNRR
jgi:hypothetical protein